MGEFLMKEAPDVDYYVQWSTNTDSPQWAGTRAETLPYLWEWDDRKPDRIPDWDPSHPENQLKRCDENGTSVRAKLAPGPFRGAWDDDGMMYEQRAVISRANIFVACHRLEDDGPDADISDLLTPFEDDVEVESR